MGLTVKLRLTLILKGCCLFGHLQQNLKKLIFSGRQETITFENGRISGENVHLLGPTPIPYIVPPWAFV